MDAVPADQRRAGWTGAPGAGEPAGGAAEGGIVGSHRGVRAGQQVRGEERTGPAHLLGPGGERLPDQELLRRRAALSNVTGQQRERRSIEVRQAAQVPVLLLLLLPATDDGHRERRRDRIFEAEVLAAEARLRRAGPQ